MLAMKVDINYSLEENVKQITKLNQQNKQVLEAKIEEVRIYKEKDSIQDQKLGLVDSQMDKIRQEMDNIIAIFSREKVTDASMIQEMTAKAVKV